MDENTKPWDGQGTITDLLKRHGVRDSFILAVDEHNRDLALELLKTAGVCDETAQRMVEVLIPNQSNGLR